MFQRAPWPGLARHWPLAPALVLGAFLRLSNLFPAYLYGDAAEYAIVARSLSHHPLNLEYPDLEGVGPAPFVSQPPLILYLFALGDRLFGASEAGPLLMNALLGLGTLVLVYLWGIELQGRLTGALAALFLAVLPMHVSLTRQAFLDVGLTFFFVLALYCFARWARTPTATWAAATGLAAGAAILSKLPGILVLVPLGAGLAWEGWRSWRAGRRDAAPETAPDAMGQAATASTVAFGAVVPADEPPAGESPDAAPEDPPKEEGAPPRAFRRVLQDTGIAAAPLVLLGLVYVGLLAYLRALVNLAEKLGWQYTRVANAAGAAANVQTERAWHYYLTDERYGLWNQFGPLLFLAAIVGTVVAVRAVLRARDARRTALLVLLVWAATVLGFFTVSSRKEWFYILPLTPAVALLAALAGARLAEWAAAQAGAIRAGLRHPRAQRAVPLAAIAVVALVLAANPWMESQASIAGVRSYGSGIREAAVFIRQQDPDAGQVGTLLGRFGLFYYNSHRTLHWFVPHDHVRSEIENGTVSFVVLDTYFPSASEAAWMEGLVADYNGEVVKEVHSRSGRVVVYELHPARGNSTSP